MDNFKLFPNAKLSIDIYNHYPPIMHKTRNLNKNRKKSVDKFDGVRQRNGINQQSILGVLAVEITE